MVQSAHSMSRWRPPRLSVAPGTLRPGLVTRGQLVLAAKAAVAAGVAWVAALAAHPQSRPYFAPLAVLLVVQPTVYDSVSRAFQRVVGVVLGVALALAVASLVAPSGWSIAVIIFVGLLLGWTTRLGPQGVVQVPVSALLVFLVGRTTPGYGGDRIVDTVIGSGIAVFAVLLSPSAPEAQAVVADVLAPLRRCRDVLGAIGTGIGAAWTPAQAAEWRSQANGLVEAIAQARQAYDAHRLHARWNARAQRAVPLLDRTGEALAAEERIAIHTRSIARALQDGSGHARPMPGLGSLLEATAAAVGAYESWVASEDAPAARRALSDAVRAADERLDETLTRVQQRWGSDAAQWLTFGTVLAMSQRALAEVGRPLAADERQR